MSNYKLLSSNAKLEKAVPGHMILGLQLAPANLSGYNVCKDASEGCAAACLFTSGRGAMPNVSEARIRKTKMFFESKNEFGNDLISDLKKALKKAQKVGVTLAVRLNTISDLPWEKIKFEGETLMAQFPEIVFYDYTKSESRMLAYLAGKMPENYSLTFSRSEDNDNSVVNVLEAGGNVAVVFRNGLPEKWSGLPVVDGDVSDARFLDPEGCIVGLIEKGKAKGDSSGFVIETEF
jgi:hypothetical protein